MATIASNSGKKNKHKTNDHDSNSNQKNAHHQYQKDNGHDSNSNQKNVHNQYRKDNDSSKIRQSPRPCVSPFLMLCVVCLCAERNADIDKAITKRLYARRRNLDKSTTRPAQ